ncbi:hypothetical protein GWI33_001163 [Rhynchophorus ferrugineus]|uniref:Uncharacterized protein n=1 Tax=Rhynchophorus ferrugineus TaxID=354439 RepID=A0A834HN82_RHYFE|nr:hypothetical protein GWI33_001163 [Rhynchophorus ferrugineus]
MGTGSKKKQEERPERGVRRSRGGAESKEKNPSHLRHKKTPRPGIFLSAKILEIQLHPKGSNGILSAQDESAKAPIAVAILKSRGFGIRAGVEGTVATLPVVCGLIRRKEIALE